MAMTREQFTKIVEALGREGYGVIRLASFVEGKQAAPIAKPATPASPARTSDDRAAYTCGVCHQPGHNARTHKTDAKPVTTASAPKAAPIAKAPAAAPSVDLGDLSFDLGDLGGSAPVAPKAAPKSAPKASAAPAPTPAPAPQPEAAPAGEASDGELAGFLDDLDSLLP